MRNTIFSLGLLAVMGLSGSAKAQTTIIAQGSCGNSLTWVLTSDSTFTISGSGDMADYIGWQEMIIDSTTIPGSIIISESDTSDAPWYSLRNVIKTAVIGDSVTTIGAYAFWDCQNLTSVAIPDSIIRIGSRAFCKCWSLISVTIPGSVTTWGDFTFDACIGLVSVIIESGVTSIGNYAFCYCSSLTSVTIPNSVATIENSSFYVCENLTSVTLPDSLISIGNYAFGSCGLTSIAIPNSVTSIGTYAFASCDSLATVTIGNSVATIGGAAFQNCSGLKSITVHAIIPPVMPVLLTIPVFRNVPDTIPVYIPCGTYNDYSTASEWNYFSNFIEMPTDTGFYSATFPQGAIYSDSNFTDLTEAGRYCISLQNENGCDSVVCLDLTYDYTGIVESLCATSLRIYPNPTTGKLTIRNEELGMSGEIEIFDVVGRKLLSYTPLTSHSSPLIEIDISHLANGLYFLKIQTSEGIITKKVVKNQINK